PLATGQGYPCDTLLKMVDEVASIRAIKDWAGNVAQHEMHVRTLQNLPRPVNVLTTHSAWLLSSLVLGCNGLLSGSGSVIADLQAELFHAVKANDLAEAGHLNDRIDPLVRVFGAAFAGGWAVASYLDLGPYGVHAMQGIFFLCGIAVMAAFIRNARGVEPFTTRG